MTVRFLLVDDHVDIRLALRAYVRRLDGCEVVGEAGDGTEAVAVASEVEPDAIILDVRMPKLDGVGALPGLRSVCPDAIIVMFSSDPDREHEAMAAGADAWCHKTDGFDTVLQRALDLYEQR